jgi:hypothetical protein
MNILPLVKHCMLNFHIFTHGKIFQKQIYATISHSFTYWRLFLTTAGNIIHYKQGR